MGPGWQAQAAALAPADGRPDGGAGRAPARDAGAAGPPVPGGRPGHRCAHRRRRRGRAAARRRPTVLPGFKEPLHEGLQEDLVHAAQCRAPVREDVAGQAMQLLHPQLTGMVGVRVYHPTPHANCAGRYPRAGGLVPWRNAVFLFVNVLPAEQAPYPNAFLDGGRRITWCAAQWSSTISPPGSRANSIALGQAACLGCCSCILLCGSYCANPGRRCSADRQRLWRLHSARALHQVHSLLRWCAARYPSPAHSARHPLMRRLLGAQLCECGSQARSRGVAAAAAGEEDHPVQPYGGALVLPMGCCGAFGRSPDPFQTLDGVPAAVALPHGGVVEAEHAKEAARVLETPAVGPCECGGTQEPAAVLLFCRTLRSPGRASGVSPSKLRSFVYCGRLGAPRVDWAAAGGYGEVTWTLQV